MAQRELNKNSNQDVILTIREACQLLNCHPNTLRKWDRSGALIALRFGSRGDRRYRLEDIKKMLSGNGKMPPPVQSDQNFLPDRKIEQRIKKLLRDNADSIQKLATAEHKKHLGGKIFRTEIIEKYQVMHKKIICSFGTYLNDVERGKTFFKKYAEKLAIEAVKDDLTIKEAVDGILFIKQAVWKTFEKHNLILQLTNTQFYNYSLKISTFSDVIAAEIAFNYHFYQTQKVQHLENDLRLVLDNVKDYSIIRLNKKGFITSWNQGAELMLGYTAQEIIGTPCSVLFTKEELKSKKPMRELKSATLKGSVEDESWIVRKDGSKLWASGITTALFDKGELQGFIKILRDRTELKEVDKQKDEFVSIISHELKNPLTSIIAFTEILQKKLETTEDQSVLKAVSVIKTQTDKLVNLISNLLEKSKIRAKGFTFKNTTFNVDTLISETINEIQMSKATHTIICRDKVNVRLYADRPKIGQLLYNLITNAIKYSPDSSEVIVNLKKTSRSLTVSVRDFGMGISQQNLDKLFTPFFRATETERESFPSMGLGLYISAEIVKHYGGKIWVKSKEGQGTTFYFSLPLKREKKLSDSTEITYP